MLKVTHNLEQVKRRARGTQQLIRQKLPELLDILGTQVLSFAQRDYRTKARGGQGTDGIKWAPLKRATLEARVRSKAPARRIVAQRKKLAEQIKKTKGKNAAQKIKSLRQKRRDQLAKLKALIDQQAAKHEIGVDTGLQRSSAAPGFTGPDGKGGNLIKRQGNTITVGYNRTYSAFFDVRRPLLPDPIPPAWQDKLDRQTTQWINGLVKDIG